MICNILINFQIISSDCEDCIDRLLSSGKISQLYSSNEDDIGYIITTKGEFVLDMFYNDIHFLYYTSLDTKLPPRLCNKLKIAPNNLPKHHRRNYPPYSIETGIKFLAYIIRQNKKTLKKKGLKKKLESLAIDISIFDTPYIETKLSKSLKEMVDITLKDTDYTQILFKWLYKNKNQ